MEGQKPLVAVLGGPLAHGRLDLMETHREEYQLVGIGSSAEAARVFADRGFPYYSYRFSRGLNPLCDLVTYRQLGALFRELKPTIVHAYGGKLCVWGCLAARRAAVPYVVGTIQGLGSLYDSASLFRRALRPAFERLQKLACRRSDLTIFQNRLDLEEFVGRGVTQRPKTALIPGLGIRTDVFDPQRFQLSDHKRVRHELGLSEVSPVVVLVTRILRTKGVFEFAKAADIVRERRRSTQFVLVGEIDHDSMDRISDAELESISRSVLCVGRRNDIAAILAASDVFVFPVTYREGMPRALLEAMAMRLPVVASDVPGCNEAVEHERSGLLVPPADPAAVAEAVIRLVEDAALSNALAVEARKRVIEKFELSRIAEQLRICYRRLIATKTAPRLRGES